MKCSCFFLKWKERVRQGKRAEKDPPEALWTSSEAEMLWSTPGLHPAKHTRLALWRKGKKTKTKRTSPQGILDSRRGGNVPFRIPRGKAPGLKQILQGSESWESETGEKGEHSTDPKGRHLNFKAWEVPYSSKSQWLSFESQAVFCNLTSAQIPGPIKKKVLIPPSKHLKPLVNWKKLRLQWSPGWAQLQARWTQLPL